MNNGFNSYERRRLETLNRRLTELQRRLHELTYTGPSKSYTIAEEAALRWALRILNADSEKVLAEIIVQERRA